MLHVTAVTHRGLVRNTNQDRIVAGRWVLGPDDPDPVEIDLALGATVAVADGMGGAAGGDLAAGLAAGVLASASRDGGPIDAVHRANRALYETSDQVPGLAGMGVTIAGVSVGPDDAVIFNIGDTRVYVEVDDELIQTSVDDSSPNRPAAVTASLGGLASYEPVTPHVSRELSAGRRFLVASDGLTGAVGDTEIRNAMAGTDDLPAVRELLRLALDRGGPDNVSIAIIRSLV